MKDGLFRFSVFVLLFFMLVAFSYGEDTKLSESKDVSFYSANRAPLAPKKFIALPLGAIRPEGWLLTQLQIQANGLTGHIDEFWPDLKNSKWRGAAKGEGWERGPYYLDGLVPLAWILNDERLKKKAHSFLDYILTSGRPDGQFGPGNDTWSNSVALKVLTQYYEAEKDPRVITLLQNYFHYLKQNPPDWPDYTWRGMRALETVLTGYWLYNRTGDPVVLDVNRDILKKAYDWRKYFANFPYKTLPVPLGSKKTMHESHVVNIAMALKNAALYYQMDPSAENQALASLAWRVIDQYHGQAGGRFSGDEHLSGKAPTQGTELCAIVESMFSLENLIETFGNVDDADRLELLAYNGNPGACTPDYWAHQYDQQANQILVDVSKRQWSNNTDTANIYGLEPHYGCCTANMHQGWPKFVSHLWMATRDYGLVAVAYGPSQVHATVGSGTKVEIREITNYPFDGTISFEIKTKAEVEFPLYLRIPNWATEKVRISVQGLEYKSQPGEFAVVKKIWKNGDVVKMELPMFLRLEKRYRDAVSLYRGPLLFSLRVGEHFEKIKQWSLQSADWKITPTTPWNYALQLEDNWQKKAVISVKVPGKLPFDNAGAPVVIKLKGSRVAWGMEANSAAPVPQSPVTSSATLEEIELIPYGCTRLRISEFPILANPK